MVTLPDTVACAPLPGGVGLSVEPYTGSLRRFLGESTHYLGNPPPGGYFAVVVRTLQAGLYGPVATGNPRGICLLGRPVARQLPQDGSVAEITRLWLAPGLPYGTASRVLRGTLWACAARGFSAVISYHDRSRHTGCIYRKAGFRKDGATRPGGKGWGSRSGRTSAGYEHTSKRRWRYQLRGES